MKHAITRLLFILAFPFVHVLAQAQDRINAGGSSFIYPLMSKWSSEYHKETGAQVNYQSVGSGGGIQQTTAKVFDFGCTDGPLNDEQLAKAREAGAEMLHIPLTMGAVVPAYNLPGVAQPLNFDGKTLAGIFLGTIRSWNAPELQALNPGVTLPDRPIAVIHRSDGSGTTYIFADYLAKTSEEWKEKVGVGTSLNWPLGTGQKGNEGIAGQVTRTAGSIGYVELIYALQNQIPYGNVMNASGEMVRASLESVKAAAASSTANLPEDLRYSITNAGGKGAYPISGTTWAIVYSKLPAQTGKQTIAFLRWTLHAGQEYAEKLNYARLPDALLTKAEAKLNQVTVAE